MPAEDHYDRLPEPVKKKASESGGSSKGIPDALKSSLESISGADLSDVRVHSNSLKPVQQQAQAYTKGNDIYLAPGQDSTSTVAHEAAHVVQQRQGQVKPGTSASGVSVNDDKGLEREADLMGKRAVIASTPKN